MFDNQVGVIRGLPFDEHQLRPRPISEDRRENLGDIAGLVSGRQTIETVE
jgi:hypothetical protein